MYNFTAFLGDFVPILVNFLLSDAVTPFIGLGILTIVIVIFRRITVV